jgi:GAF domain-containing protein
MQDEIPLARESWWSYFERGMHSPRSQVGVPLLLRGEAIGVLHLCRSEVRPFSERDIALLETFADQAVIAIENARLFEKLGQRTTELPQTLEQQTAVSGFLARDRLVAYEPPGRAANDAGDS